MNSPAATIVRGPSVEDLVQSVCHVIQRSPAGLLAGFRRKGHYPLLWTGPVRVTNDCRRVRAQGLELPDAFGEVSGVRDVVWAFPDGDGAEARLYGRIQLRAERAPELDDVELPVELVTEIVCISLEIPTHGISLMARLPEPLTTAARASAITLPSGRSMQEAAAACLTSADWDRR